MMDGRFVRWWLALCTALWLVACVGNPQPFPQNGDVPVFGHGDGDDDADDADDDAASDDAGPQDTGSAPADASDATDAGTDGADAAD